MCSSIVLKPTGVTPTPTPTVSITGTVLAEDKTPVQDASVSVNLQDKNYTTKTNSIGSYILELPQDYQFPTFFAGTIQKQGLKPSTILFNYAEKKLSTVSGTNSPTLAVAKDSDVIIPSGLNIHHLGDDSFGGTVNSQLQVAAEGVSWAANAFVYTQELKQKYAKVCFSFNARGVQSTSNKDTISISDASHVGTSLSLLLDDSLQNGSFSTQDKCFSLSSFPVGSTVSVQVNSKSRNSSDYDDFEFINLMGSLR